MKENIKKHFDIFPLLHAVAVRERPALPPLLKKSERKNGTWYSREIDNLLGSAGVPKDKGGWYVWGRFNDAAWWQPIYIGKASPGAKWGLYARLRDELREESPAIFAAVYGRDAATTAVRKLLNAHMRKNKMDFFKKGEAVQRALRKTDTHFIIWAEAPDGISEKEMRLVESVLIYRYRPSFNSKRPHGKETSAAGNPLAANAERQIEEEIDRMRGEFKI